MYNKVAIQIVDQDLRKKFGIAQPVIRVAGLNPHAGESGYLGHEEIEVILPAIESAKKLGIEVSGPYPGDTMFDAAALEQVKTARARAPRSSPCSPTSPTARRSSRCGTSSQR